MIGPVDFHSPSPDSADSEPTGTACEIFLPERHEPMQNWRDLVAGLRAGLIVAPVVVLSLWLLPLPPRWSWVGWVLAGMTLLFVAVAIPLVCYGMRLIACQSKAVSASDRPCVRINADTLAWVRQDLGAQISRGRVAWSQIRSITIEPDTPIGTQDWVARINPRQARVAGDWFGRLVVRTDDESHVIARGYSLACLQQAVDRMRRWCLEQSTPPQVGFVSVHVGERRCITVPVAVIEPWVEHPAPGTDLLVLPRLSLWGNLTMRVLAAVVMVAALMGLEMAAEIILWAWRVLPGFTFMDPRWWLLAGAMPLITGVPLGFGLWLLMRRYTTVLIDGGHFSRLVEWYGRRWDLTVPIDSVALVCCESELGWGRWGFNLVYVYLHDGRRRFLMETSDRRAMVALVAAMNHSLGLGPISPWDDSLFGSDRPKLGPVRD